jgi:hypothetical protein
VKVAGSRRLALVAAFAIVAGALPESAEAATPKPAAVSRVTVTRTTVAPRAKVTLRARVRNRAAGAARVRVSFYASANARWDRKDVKLGSVTSTRLKRGKSGGVTLSARLPSAVKRGSWTLFACTGSSDHPTCVKSARRLVVKATTQPARPAAPTPPNQPGTPDKSTPPDGDHPDGPGDSDLPAQGDPALTLQVASDVEWSRNQFPDGDYPQEGDTVTSQLRLGTDVAGEAGYERTTMPAAAAVTGQETVLAGEGGPSSVDLDDGNVPLTLPFAFPFAGVSTTEIDVSTNGWIGLAGPAFAYDTTAWRNDYRGAEATLGDHLAAIAPFWDDLSLDPASLSNGTAADPVGRIVLVQPSNGQSVAIRWEAYPYGGDASEGFQTFEVVLFRDGRVRFDYLQRPPFSGLNVSPVIGLSPGIEGRQPNVDILPDDATVAPEDSYLYTPTAVDSTAPSGAGTASLTLPRGSQLVDADAGCEVAQDPTLLAEGHVDCSVPSVAAGDTATAQVSWAYPSWLFGYPEQTATWNAGDLTQTDSVELTEDGFADGQGTTLEADPDSTGGAPTVGLLSHSENLQLRHPRLTSTVPAGLTVTGISIEGIDLDAGQIAAACGTLRTDANGGTISCELPNGIDLTSGAGILFGPAAAGDYSLSFTVTADNLPSPITADATVTVPAG